MKPQRALIMQNGSYCTYRNKQLRKLSRCFGKRQPLYSFLLFFCLCRVLHKVRYFHSISQKGEGAINRCFLPSLSSPAGSLPQPGSESTSSPSWSWTSPLSLYDPGKSECSYKYLGAPSAFYNFEKCLVSFSPFCPDHQGPLYEPANCKLKRHILREHFGAPSSLQN